MCFQEHVLYSTAVSVATSQKQPDDWKIFLILTTCTAAWYSCCMYGCGFLRLKEADGKKKKKNTDCHSSLAFLFLRRLCALFIHVLMNGRLLLVDTFNAAHGQEI